MGIAIMIDEMIRRKRRVRHRDERGERQKEDREISTPLIE